MGKRHGYWTKCNVCNRNFFLRDGWPYHDGDEYYCSEDCALEAYYDYLWEKEGYWL